jgi:hypothetical protein
MRDLTFDIGDRVYDIVRKQLGEVIFFLFDDLVVAYVSLEDGLVYKSKIGDLTRGE